MSNDFDVVFKNEQTGETRTFTFTLADYISATAWIEEGKVKKSFAAELALELIEADAQSTVRQAAYCAVTVWKQNLQ